VQLRQTHNQQHTYHATRFTEAKAANSGAMAASLLPPGFNAESRVGQREDRPHVETVRIRAAHAFAWSRVVLRTSVPKAISTIIDLLSP
jgi:hypothetical protein